MKCNVQVARILREELGPMINLIGTLVNPGRAKSIDREVDALVRASACLCDHLAASLSRGKRLDPPVTKLNDPDFSSRVLERLVEGSASGLVSTQELGLLARQLRWLYKKPRTKAAPKEAA